MPPSSNLPPLEAILLPETNPAERRLWWYGVGLAVFVGLFFVSAVVGLIYLAVNPVQRAVVKHETLAEKRQQILAAFTPAAAITHPDRRNLERFLDRIAAASNREDQRQFRALVDFDTLTARVFAHPDMPKLSYLDRIPFENTLQQEGGPAPLQRLRLVSVQALDEDHLLLYAQAEQNTGQAEPWRFWVRRQGKNWKLVDWEQIDFGYSTSDRYAMHEAALASLQSAQYQQAQYHLTRAQQLRIEGKYEEVAAELKLAAKGNLPPVIAEQQLYLMMVEWREIHRSQETLELCRRAGASLRSPGFQQTLATTLAAQRDFASALAASEAYEQAAGFQPSAVKVRARALENLDRHAEALAAYEQLGKFAPGDATVLRELYRLLPPERKAEIVKFVERSPNPATVAADQATSILHSDDDYQTAELLEKLIARQAPDSTDHLRVRAALREAAGEPELAADLYRQAAEHATSDDDKANCWWWYLSAMRNTDKLLAGIQSHPEPARALQIVFDELLDSDEAESRDLQPILAEWLSREPEAPRANYEAGVLALQSGNLEQAQRHFQTVKDHAEGDEQYWQTEADRQLLLIALYQGRAVSAQQAAADPALAYVQLVQHAFRLHEWETLQQLNDAIRPQPTAQQNAWFLISEARLALHAGQKERAVQQMLLAKLQNGEGSKHAEEFTLNFHQTAILGQAYGIVEAYNKHPQPVDAFQEYFYEALNHHDWPTADALLQLHKQSHPDDYETLFASYQLASRQGRHEEVARLLFPFPDRARIEHGWMRNSACQTVVKSLCQLQRFDDALALATTQGFDADQLQLYVHLRQGDVAAAQVLLAKKKNSELLSEVLNTFSDDMPALLQDARLTQLWREVAVPLHDDFDCSLVLLSSEEPLWTGELLREKFSAAIPGVELGPPREHAAGTTFPLIIPGGEACRFQMTLGNSPYTTLELANENHIPYRLRALITQHQSWLAVEATKAPSESATDQPWQLARRLTATLCDEKTLAVGYSEPEGSLPQFVQADERLPDVLRSNQRLDAAFAGRPQTWLPFAVQHEQPSKSVERELKQLARQFRAGKAPPTLIRIAHDQGRHRETPWLRVVRIGPYEYRVSHIDAEPIRGAEPAGLLPQRRYRVFAQQVLELRAE